MKTSCERHSEEGWKIDDSRAPDVSVSRELPAGHSQTPCRFMVRWPRWAASSSKYKLGEAGRKHPSGDTP